jgi:hypothetical protein
MMDLHLIQQFFLNTLYAVGGVILGVVAAIVTYKLFNKVTNFHIGNLAVGVVVCGIFIMIGLIVGQIVSMSLN